MPQQHLCAGDSTISEQSSHTHSTLFWPWQGLCHTIQRTKCCLCMGHTWFRHWSRAGRRYIQHNDVQFSEKQAVTSRNIRPYGGHFSDVLAAWVVENVDWNISTPMGWITVNRSSDSQIIYPNSCNSNESLVNNNLKCYLANDAMILWKTVILVNFSILMLSLSTYRNSRCWASLAELLAWVL